MSSADNLCKQFGSRSGPTKCWAWSGPKLYDPPERIFQQQQIYFENNQQTTKRNEKLPSRQKIKKVSLMENHINLLDADLT